ncbi:zinc-dependent alcohol dehydrogenase family protein [Halotia wernerae UHCC 0503]|nr:zinc-dependent alcohol dehydrogenase family protein [Halotia wernerae UHCC 0503]
MRAAQHTGYGRPHEVIRIVDAPEPIPADDEVTVSVEAAAMHIADLKFCQGDPGFRWFTFPRWAGEEGVGRITACGAQVKDLAVGERVVLPRGIGAFRQKLCVAAARVIPAPVGEPEQLALATVNAMTAFILLTDYAKAAPGEWILQSGGNSSCGRFIIALAKDAGIRTVSIVRRPSLAQELLALGADAAVVDSGDADDMALKIAAVTGGATIRTGFDCIAGKMTETVARALGDGGTVVCYGFASGLNSEMAFRDLFRRLLTLVGMSMADGRSPAERRLIYNDLIGKLGTGALRAKIAGRYPLENIHAAYALQAKNGAERDGKIIVLPNG